MGKTKEELNISEELLALISEKAREVLHRTPVEPEILKKISEYNLMQLTSMDKKTTKWLYKDGLKLFKKVALRQLYLVLKSVSILMYIN